MVKPDLKKPKKREVKAEVYTSKTLPFAPNAFMPHTAKQYLYKPFVLLPDLTDLISKTIEVRVHKVYITKFNKAVQYQQFYGNDFYSSDSDVVCIL